MKTITKRELNQQTAQVLAAVDAGESVVVTERGVPRWRIDAFDAEADTDPIERLRAQGRIIPAKQNPMPWPEPEDNPRYSPADVDRLYAEMREDR
jgi:antitoxin (DNA-binding transcriptional repressor) of toxin-antitoxin stability system